MIDPLSLAGTVIKTLVDIIELCDKIESIINRPKLVGQELNGFRSRLTAFANFLKSLQNTIERISTSITGDGDGLHDCFESMSGSLTSAKRFVKYALNEVKKDPRKSKHGIGKYFGGTYRAQVILDLENNLSGWQQDLGLQMQLLTYKLTSVV